MCVDCPTVDRLRSEWATNVCIDFETATLPLKVEKICREWVAAEVGHNLLKRDGRSASGGPPMQVGRSLA
ncbi:hypothetical protein ACLOJK_019737, partial [Asimina triloba]